MNIHTHYCGVWVCVSVWPAEWLRRNSNAVFFSLSPAPAPLSSPFLSLPAFCPSPPWFRPAFSPFLRFPPWFCFWCFSECESLPLLLFLLLRLMRYGNARSTGSCWPHRELHCVLKSPCGENTDYFFIACVWRGCNHTLQWSTFRVLLLPLKANIHIYMWGLRVGFPAKSIRCDVQARSRASLSLFQSMRPTALQLTTWVW